MMNSKLGELYYTKSDSEFINTAKELLINKIQQVLDIKERCALAISGGETPYPILHKIAQEKNKYTFWSKIDLFWVDERCVSSNHPESNFSNAEKYFLGKIPEIIAYRIEAEKFPKEAAKLYDTKLREYFDNSLPKFDIMILGMGEDGHTASLFQETEALNEDKAWVKENYVKELTMWRITMTLPVLKNAANRFFWISGDTKQELLEEILKLKKQKYPIQLLFPSNSVDAWVIE